MSENDEEITEIEETEEPDVEAHRFDARRNDDRADRADGHGRVDTRVERAE
jgi:hypothetical protein